jgi:hypothetical protein
MGLRRLVGFARRRRKEFRGSFSSSPRRKLRIQSRLVGVAGALTLPFLMAAQLAGNDKEQPQPDPAIEILDRLIADGLLDRVTNGAYKVHVVKLQAGKTYLISMSRKDDRQRFNPWLRIEDSSFKQLVPDPARIVVTARIRFTPPKDDEYRIIASCRGGPGEYVLRIAPDGTALSGVNEDGLLLRWLVLAPIPLAANETGAAAIGKEQIKEEARLQPRAGQKVKVGGLELIWKEHVVDDHLLDFNGLLGRQTDDAAAYAVTYIVAPDELKGIKMKTGSDDHLKVYLNGKEVMRFTGARGAALDQDTTEVTLKKGVNVLVAKVINEKGDWKLCVRFTDKDHKALTKLKCKTAQ